MKYAIVQQLGNPSPPILGDNPLKLLRAGGGRISKLL